MSTHRASERAAPVELTFDLCPVFQVSSSKPGYLDEYPFSRSVEIPFEEATETFDQSWVIRAAAGVGLPRGIDQDVYMSIVALLERSGGMPKDHTLYFTLYELLEILGWSSGGSMRRRLKHSLERIASTTISATNAFWSTQHQTLISKTFKAFSVSFGHYSDPRSGLRERHRLVFDQFFAEHWSDTHDSGTNLAFYWQLEGHVARRLYRLIDLQASQPGKGGPRSWQLRLDELRDLLPLANYRYASLIKDKLRSAHDQLVEKGYLRAYQYYSPEGKRGPTLVRYEISSSFDKLRLVNDIERDPAKAAALQRMLAVTSNFEDRMSRRSARALIEEYGAETCLHYAEILPFRKEAKGAGLLVRAIKDGYDWERPSEVRTNISIPGGNDQKDPLDTLGTPSQESPSNDGPMKSEDSTDSEVQDPQIPQYASQMVQGSEASAVVEDEPSPERIPIEKALADRFYQEIISRLSQGAPATNVERWFEEIHARDLDGGTLTLVVPNEQARDYISSRFKEEAESHLSEVLSDRGYTGEVELRLVVGEGG